MVGVEEVSATWSAEGEGGRSLECRHVVPPAGLEPTHPAPEAGALSN